MKVVILAGGYGTRISEETNNKPKPMVSIGGKPILWHIMKYYSYFGHNDFIICCGYKSEIIKDFFSLNKNKEKNWSVNCFDTGLKTMTGGRLKRIHNLIDKDETFMFTYGDGLSNVNIDELIEFHLSKKQKATVTAVFPPSRFGALQIDDKNNVTSFEEKPKNDSLMINGGFFVLHESVLNLIKNDETVWEKDPMEKLVKKKNLSAYKHRGFFLPMDTLRDKNQLEQYWEDGKAKWKLWKN
mgnify:CR=1 FL=1|tara:strand:+ start:522 stop:1244 length:723 start_codon:yes stop_codon:yes gene_type:complete